MHEQDTTRLQAILTAHALSDPSLLAETSASIVWRATHADGAARVVKLYRKGHMGNEAHGFDVMAAWAAAGSARVPKDLITFPDGAVMEYLDGPSMGDRTRKGEDERACARLASIAADLHRSRITVSLPSLNDWFQDLFDLRLAPECSFRTRSLIRRACDVAHRLLQSSDAPVPLHGDLHHDNVIETPRGTVAFDAKGVLGDKAFELANAMRNPKGFDAGMRDPTVIQRRLRQFSNGLGVNPHRLAQWSAAKCALSIAWRANGRLTTDKDVDLLRLFLRVVDTL